MPPYAAHVPDRDHRERLRCETVEPLARGHGLVGVGVVPEPAPVPLALDRLVRDRALDHEHERLELAAVGLEEPLDEIVGAADRSAFEVDQWPVHRDLRETRERAERDLLDARLSRGGERDGIAVAAQAGIDPQHMDDGLVRRGFGRRHDVTSRGRPAARRLPVPGLPPGSVPVNECLVHRLTAAEAQALSGGHAAVPGHRG